MALGDGIRRDVATISQAERDRLRDAIVALNHRYYPGSRTDTPAGHVSFWFKQDEIHQATHVHGGPAFLTWHRELCNRFEQLIREVDPELSLHYWDWNSDPAPWLTAAFFGNANGSIGDPWRAAGFYDPSASPFRGDPFDTVNYNPADPPHNVTRNKQGGAPPVGGAGWPADAAILAAPTYPAMRNLLEDAHDNAHGYIGGTLGDPHASFRDPIVFLLHSNVDRLFAMWQAAAGQAWRLDPNQVYGSEGGSAAILENLQPWAGGGAGHPATRPWAPPENQQVVKNSRHPSVVAPPCYDTLPTIVEVLEVENPGSVIHFNDVPTGETAARAAVFRIWSCGSVTLQVKAGTEPVAPYSTLTPGGQVVVPRSLGPYAEGRIWFGFTGQAPGTNGPAGGVTIHCVDNGQDYPFTFQANSIDRPTVGVMLALDQSGSMDDFAGSTGAHRIDVLRESASQFVEVIQPQNGIGVVRFDHDAYPINDANWPGLAMTRIGGAGILDAGRVAARAAVQNHRTNPSGATSIGDGVALARTTLNGVPVGDYDQKAIIVFTDGLENSAATIASVMSSIDARTFAIGLGTETQVSTAALRALTNGTGGYLLLTGHLTASVDSFFRLTKYFLQILAGVTNTNIVLDPIGAVSSGQTIRIPFNLAETDIETTILVLEDARLLRLTLETPAGDRIDPAVATAAGDVYADGTNLSYYRLNLPVPVGAGAHEGTWQAVLQVDGRRYKRELARLKKENPDLAKRVQNRGVSYSLNVHTLSNLRMAARLDQAGLQPGTDFVIHVLLTEYGIPVEQRATVIANIESPDGTRALRALAEVAPGVFEVTTRASLAGIYRVTVRAAGTTMRGLPFTREQLMTGAVFQGGDGPFPFGGGDPSGADERLCRLLHCLLGSDGVQRLLKQYRLDAAARCLERYCVREPVEVAMARPQAPPRRRATKRKR